jgi:hypothetical protein
MTWRKRRPSYARYLGKLTAHQRERFDGWWKDCAEQGFCDGFGGAQYRRALNQWAKEGAPSGIANWLAAFFAESDRAPEQ